MPKVAKNLSITCLHLIAIGYRTNRQIGCNIFPVRMTCAELWCQIFLEHFPQLCNCVKCQPWRRQLVYDNTIFLKWGILNVPLCSIFVPFHFYLIMTLVVLCLDNMYIFMVLLISALGNFLKIGATKLSFWILVPLGGRGGVCMRGHGLLSLYSSYTKFK